MKPTCSLLIPMLLMSFALTPRALFAGNDLAIHATGKITVHNHVLVDAGNFTVESGGEISIDLTGQVTSTAALYGGTLTVQLAGQKIAAGESFKLFDAASYVGAFDTFNLPPLTGQLGWDTRFLSVDGTLRVVQLGPVNLMLALDKTSINENDSVTLMGSFSELSSQLAHTVALDWGDGSAVTNINLDANTLTFSAPHQYLNNPLGQPQGSFNVTATVTNSSSQTAMASTSVQVSNVAPVPAVSGAPASFTPNTAINLMGTAVDPGTLDTLAFAWTAAAGGVQFASGNDATFTFTPTQAADVSVALTVTDSDGASGNINLVIPLATAPMLVSGPLAAPNPAVTDLAVTFSAAANPADALLTWNFGDGSAAGAGATVQHIYTIAGTYAVALTVKNMLTGAAQVAILSVQIFDNVSVLPGELPAKTGKGVLDFKKNGDVLKITSTLILRNGIDLTQTPLTVTLNTLQRVFNFDKNGRPASHGSFARLYFRKNQKPVAVQDARLLIQLKGTDFRNQIAAATDQDALGLPKKAGILFDFDGKRYSAVALFNFKKHGSGFESKFTFGAK